MTDYRDDSFDLYVIFYQGKYFEKSFVVESFLSWRRDDTLKSNLDEIHERYPLFVSPRLLLKIATAAENRDPSFDLIKYFEKNVINEFAVSSHLYFLDAETLKEKISSFFNKQNLTYISVWGDWEALIRVT